VEKQRQHEDQYLLAQITTAPMKNIPSNVLRDVRDARKSSVLNVGYFTSLTIIHERTTSAAGSTYLNC